MTFSWDYFLALLVENRQTHEEDVSLMSLLDNEDEDISVEEVFKAIRDLKSGKASGINEVRSEFIKNSGEAGIF